MADISSRLKQIDNRSKTIVNGFIRESQDLLPFEENAYYNLTELIVQICLIYYAINEHWDVLAADFAAEEDKRMLKRLQGASWENTNYGKQIIPSIGDLIYEWYLKIGNLEYGYAFIGICDAKCDMTHDSAYWSVFKRYFYAGYHGKISGEFGRDKDGKKYATGDTVMIRLNTKDRTIEFLHKAGDHDQELQSVVKVPIKAEETLSYRLAATIYYGKCYITLQKFEVYKA